MPRLPLRAAGAALLCCLGGCVVPLAPEFEPEENLPPYLVSASPALASKTAARTFTITVQDPNPRDTFYVRWLIDYPPYDQRIVWQLAEKYNVPSNPATINFDPDCTLHRISGSGDHRLMALVSDRPFLEPSSAPDRPFEVTPPGTYPVRAVWLFSLMCP